MSSDEPFQPSSDLSPEPIAPEFAKPESSDAESTDSGGEASPASPADTQGKPAPSMRSAYIVAAFAVAFSLLAQWFAPFFDYQNANLITLTCLALGAAYFLFALYRRERWGGNVKRLPIFLIVTTALLLVLFRFEGFSGEMFPQFVFRFGQPGQRELKELSSEVIADKSESLSDFSAGQSLSPQFLGPNRNGVYSNRQFAIPETQSDVRVVWDQGIGAGWSSFAVVGDRAVTLEQRDGKECLTCYRLGDGELLWIQEHPGLHSNPLGGSGPRSTPTIYRGRVFATSATGNLWCVDLATGKNKWTVDLFALAGWTQMEFESAVTWGYSASPLLVDSSAGQRLCVVPLGGPIDSDKSASLAAFDCVSGELVWKSGTDQISYASPTSVSLGGQQQIVSVNEKTVSGHTIDSGDVLWEFDWPGLSNASANCASAVSVGDDQILVGKGYGGGSALVEVSVSDDGKWETRDVWRSSRVLKTKFNHTCVDGTTGYAINNGALQAVNLLDGTAYWSQPRRIRAGQGQVVLADDTLVLQDEAGDLVFVRATEKAYSELFRMPALDSKTWNIPAIAGRFVLVRNDRQAICFELPDVDQ